MKIPATAAEIRILLQLASLDEQAPASGHDAAPGRREALRKSAAGPLLERYDALVGLGRTPALAPIERGACSGCHIRLATMVEHVLRHSSIVQVCPRCRRLLYAPERLAPPQAGPVAEKARDRRKEPARR